MVLPQHFPPPKQYPSNRVPKAEILKALNASEKELPLPALVNQYDFDSATMRSQRQRAILGVIIPHILQKTFPINTITSSLHTAGLPPIGPGKPAVLSTFPQGPSPLQQNRSYPTVSGPVLASQELLAEICIFCSNKHDSRER